MRVLDFGCKDARLKNLLGLYVQRAEFVLMDKVKKGNEVVKFDFSLGSHVLPFPDDFFDLVLCVNVLEYVELPDLLIAEFLRVCKGDVIVTYPSFLFDEHKSSFFLKRILWRFNIPFKYERLGGRFFGYHYFTFRGLE